MNLPTNDAFETLQQLNERAASHADGALQSSQKAVDETIESLRVQADDMGATASEALTRAASAAGDVGRRGLAGARQLQDDVSEQALQWADDARSFIKEQPVKAMLIAGGIGAFLTLALRATRPAR